MNGGLSRQNEGLPILEEGRSAQTTVSLTFAFVTVAASLAAFWKAGYV
jgi:hypothetical protein